MNYNMLFDISSAPYWFKRSVSVGGYPMVIASWYIILGISTSNTFGIWTFGLEQMTRIESTKIDCAAEQDSSMMYSMRICTFFSPFFPSRAMSSNRVVFRSTSRSLNQTYQTSGVLIAAFHISLIDLTPKTLSCLLISVSWRSILVR